MDYRAEFLNLQKNHYFTCLPQSQLKHVCFVLKTGCLLFCASLLSCAPSALIRCFLWWPTEVASWKSLWSRGDRWVCSGPGSQLLDTSAEGSEVHPGWGSQTASPHHHLSQVSSSQSQVLLLFMQPNASECLKCQDISWMWIIYWYPPWAGFGHTARTTSDLFYW